MGGSAFVTLPLLAICLLLAGNVFAQALAVSDDFSGPSLDGSLWTFVDPVGDCSVLQANGVVTISVPGGTNHDLWTSGNDAARIMQPITNGDFEVEAKIDNLPEQRFQVAGLLFEESPGNYIRVDYYHDGTDLHLFAASFVNDVPTLRGNTTVATGGTGYLRVVRAGDQFTVTFSDDGTFPAPNFVFSHVINLAQVGVFAGNVGTPAPAYDARFDYFFDNADPIDPEDGGLVDIWPPQITVLDIVPDVGAGTATITATTSEQATSLVSFGTDALYGTDVPGTTLDGLNHEFVLTGLVAGTDYHFSVTATDTLANAASTPDDVFTFNDIVSEVLVWHGSNQSVGHLGPAQADFNLLGTVSNWEYLTSLEYSLNGAPYQPLNWGSEPDGYGDHRRLARNGDFNVDMPISQLLPGANTFLVRSLNSFGKADSVLTTVTLETGSYPFPVNIDWSTVTDPQDVGQYVDGKWDIEGDGIRTTRIGYDRVFLIGDETWQDYEITTPMTIHGLEEPGPRSSDAGMGFLMRFTGHIIGGHRDFPYAQPKWGYQPFGGIGWLRWLGGINNDPTVQFYHGDYDVEENFGGAKAVYGPGLVEEPDVAAMPFGDPSMATDFGLANIQVGETFWMKMRCQTMPNAPNGDGVTLYSLKIWTDAEPEPVEWNFQIPQQSEFALRQGGVLLLAHHVDVTFGDVSVIDLSSGVPNTPPVANDDVLSLLKGAAEDINVLANDSDIDGVLDPGTVAIVDAPLNGTVTGIDPVTGVVTYQHDDGVALADSFTYTVDDNSGDPSNTAMVRVTINPEPLPNFVSDDFNSCDVDPVWTFVDPQGDSPPPVITGSFSGDAQVAISVPGGSSHEPYDFNLGMPYLLQAAENQDFTAEVKFTSALPDSAYALQGLLVRQDDNSWLRFDFYSDGAGYTRLYASTPPASGGQVNLSVAPAGTFPLYLRVQRTGDIWDLDYSLDGSVYTDAATFGYAMNVTGVGVYAGNAGGASAPDFTAFVDYFANFGDDPVSEPDDQDLNSLAVTVAGSGSVTPVPDQAVYACDEPVTLTAVPDPGWQFDGWSGDLTGTDNPAVVTMNRHKDVTATFSLSGGTVVAANTSGVSGLSPSQSCAAGIPVEISRDTALDVRGYTLTLELTNLDLCAGTGSIVEGGFLDSVSPTDFVVTDNLDGTYLVDATILGEPCGATALTGTLFTLDVTNTIPDGTGSIAITNLELRDCANSPLGAAAGAPGTILIDSTAPAPVTDLAASLAASGSPAGNVGTVDVVWTPSGDADVAEVRVYRKSFGTYPEYDDDGGAAPILPTDPLAEGWALVSAVPAGSHMADDLAPGRDYFTFCAVAVDSVGNTSTAAMSGPVLNYLLGDVSDGAAQPADGDNIVWTEDLSLLGAHYGTADGDAQYLNTLDVGPTDDASVNGLPLTDDLIDFEDLILVGINYGNDLVGATPALSFPGVPSPAGLNAMTVEVPAIPAVGQTFDVEVMMSGDGSIQGLSAVLAWNDAVVQPVGYASGPLLASQGGTSVVLSPGDGIVDVCLAGVRDVGISGTGTVAYVTFEVLAAGLPTIGLDTVDARDPDNQPVSVYTSGASAVGEVAPSVSALHGNYPNPFNPQTTIAFDLARAGRVRIDVYGIDGRLVRRLVDGDYGAGRHTTVFDGRDQAGRQVASGTYLYVMRGPDFTDTRRMLLVK